MSRVIDSSGQVLDVPEDQVGQALQQGLRRFDASQNPDFETTAPKDTSISGAVSAALSSGLSTATLGASDVALRLVGSKADVEKDRKLREDHGIASTVGAIAGAVLPSGVTGGIGRLGESAAERAGGGLLGTAVRGATEGSIYGAGAGVSELALSDQPITAERVVQTMGSNILLGGATGGLIGAGGKLVERGLVRAGDRLAEASAARTALETIPEDLSTLDEKGLSEAAKAAKAEHAADITSERQSLEDIRKNQRTEMAHQVQDLHANLATERPIYEALTEADKSTLNAKLKDIDGVSDAHVQLAKSYKSLRGKFDNMLSLETNPEQLIAPLQQRQGALEALQAKMPELNAALAGDARASSLQHIDAALADTKEQLANIQALGKSNPVASGRLTMLESGPSARMQAIDAAKEALGKAPEIGLVGKGATGAAFAGATALAHMIPGVGLAAPFVGKAASDAVGSLFKRMAGAHSEIIGKTAGAMGRFLNTAARGAGKVAEVGPRIAATTATETLRNVRFGPDDGAAQPTDLHELYKARSAELRQQTEFAPDGSVQMRPEARAEMAKKLDPVRQVNPLLADQLETVAARRTAFVSSKLPRQPQVGNLQIGPDTWRPSDLQMRSFARTVRAAEDPSSVEERLANGIVTPEEAEAYRTVYPERFADLQATIFRLAPQLAKTLPTHKKVALAVFTGIPTMPALQPNVFKVLQGTFADEPGSQGGTAAPKPEPNFGALGSLKSLDKPTATQQRSE